MKRLFILLAAASFIMIAAECQAARHKPVRAAAAKAACLTGKVAKAAVAAPVVALRALRPCRGG